MNMDNFGVNSVKTVLWKLPQFLNIDPYFTPTPIRKYSSIFISLSAITIFFARGGGKVTVLRSALTPFLPEMIQTWRLWETKYLYYKYIWKFKTRKVFSPHRCRDSGRDSLAIAVRKNNDRWRHQLMAKQNEVFT